MGVGTLEQKPVESASKARRLLSHALGFAVREMGRREALGLAVVGILILLLAYQVPSAYLVDIGSAGDDWYADGFSWPEMSGADTIRWSQDTATIRFDGVGNEPYLLTLRLNGIRPDRAPRLDISVNGSLVKSDVVSGQMTEYAIPLGRQLVGPSGAVAVTLHSETFKPSQDRGELGVMVDWVRLAPVEHGGPVLPPPFHFALLAAIPWAVFLALRARRTSLLPSAALASLLAIILAVAVATARLPLAVAAPRAALAALAASLAWVMVLKPLQTWERVALASLIGAAGYYLWFIIPVFSFPTVFADMHVFHAAAQNLAQGRELYDFYAARNFPNDPVYKHPATFALLLTPLAGLSLEQAALVWLVVNHFIFGGAVLVILRTVGIRFRSRAFYLALIGVLVFRPAIESLWRGQPDFLILLGLASSLLLLQRGKDFGAGLALSVAAMLKLYPALAALLFVLHRRWAALAGFLTGCLAIGALLVAVIGWQNNVRYVTEILMVQNAAVPWPENQSFTGFVSRLIIPPEETSWETTIPLPLAAGVALAGINLASLAASAWVIHTHRRLDDPLLLGLQFSSLVCLMLLVWPTAWIHYETMLLLPLAALLSWSCRDHEARRGDRLGIAMLAAGFALVAFGKEDMLVGRELYYGIASLIRSYKLYGIFLIWLGCLRAILRTPEPES